MEEEIAELRAEIANKNNNKIKDELGDFSNPFSSEICDP